MSTIATPREPPMRRVPSSTQTPTSSNRPSLETSRSVSSSPSQTTVAAAAAGGASEMSGGAAGRGAPAGGATRRNRAALREYYNLKNTGTPTVEVTEAIEEGDNGSDAAMHTNNLLANSEVPPSAMDAPNFEADAFVQKMLQESSLEDLLRTYTRVLGETRALDAEKKSLVYDNYSRLITATETIRKMRATMDPLNPMASTLDPAIAHIYNQAKALRDAMRQTVPAPDDSSKDFARARTIELAEKVLNTPARLRQFVKEGRTEEAEAAWQRPRQLLEAWRQQGVGGDDVEACLADGAAALRGEPSPAGWTVQAA
ncbi:hypothetical protein SEPCBS57363_001891 [Sporothrix epigloea]|uniref:Vacuolar protein sorting-associated protein 51 homolog n=1 Tax=Sporothrix epigloea TaxID=1892477 RepID=A0ABP0DCS2_9PEZI